MGALLRMFRYLKSSAGVLAVAMLLLLSGTLLNLAQPQFVQRAVDCGITAGDLRRSCSAPAASSSPPWLRQRLLPGQRRVRHPRRPAHRLRGAQ